MKTKYSIRHTVIDLLQYMISLTERVIKFPSIYENTGGKTTLSYILLLRFSNRRLIRKTAL